MKRKKNELFLLKVAVAHSETGRIVPAEMITKMIRFDRVVEDGFDALINDKENQIKIMIDMEAEPAL